MTDSLNISRTAGNFKRTAMNIANTIKTGIVQQSDTDKASTVANNGAQVKLPIFGFGYPSNATACGSMSEPK
jgi:hypothetical protein